MDCALCYLPTRVARIGLGTLAGVALAILASAAAITPARAASFDPNAAAQQLVNDINLARAQSGLPALVNNPAPNVDWRDFDTVVAPWLKGDRFLDKVPLGYWPLPEPDYLRNYDVRSRLRYWSLATTHFDQSDWLDKTAVVLTVGYANAIVMTPPEGVTADVPDPTTIIVKGADKQKVGQFAAEIRASRKPEPYKGKGIRYENEVVRRKEGKSFASGG